MTRPSLTHTKPQRYIIFTGPSQSGKSTGAALLVSMFRQRNRSAVHCSFEAPMKHYLAMLLGLKLDAFKMDDSLSELLSKTGKDFLRLEAAHMRFNYGPNVMGALLRARTKHWRHNPAYVVVDDGVSVLDCRALGDYFLIQIVREVSDRVYPFMIPNADAHIRNNGTLDDLKAKVEKIANILEMERDR